MGVFSPHIREKYRKKILLVLDYLKVSHNEIIYIWTYKKHEVSPELSLNDLWCIYQLDLEWDEIFPRRKIL